MALGSAPRLADASGASRDDGRSVVAPDRERSRYPRPDRPAFEPPDAMFFHDWGVNPWQDSWRDSRSTFALDVDTGSYGLVRSYLEQGLMPPPAAVRVEEMVNAIDQGYRQPWAEDFALRIDGARDPFGADANEVLLRVGIQARAVSQRQRLPARLSFVIDVSGSMGGDNRLELVKDALATLVEGLGPDDAVAIVAYSDEAWVVLPMTPADQPHRILRALEALQPQASTNAEAGIALGYDLAAEAFEPEAINRVVLCSDGVANVGARGPRAILQRIERELARGITLTAVGVGMGNYNDALMEQLADHGEGSYHYVDDRREARRIFGENLTATLQLVARDAKVQVEFNPKTVWAYRLIGYENRDLADRDFEDDRVDAGEIGAGQSATALYALSLVPDARGELATVQLRWARADSGEVRSLEAHARASDLVERWDHADAAFRLTGALATFAEILRESPYAEGLSLDAVIGIADAAARDLGSDEAYAVADLMALAGEPRRAGFESRRSHGYPERAPESGRSGTGAGRAGTDRSTGLDKCVAICILVFRCSNSYASSVDGELR
ncbi:MAG: von Willebrand factor type A domain-containing protein [Caldilineae bacterium]|nr:von Willebrand factor type A domain-containing protein [Caldilineae bacterium]